MSRDGSKHEDDATFRRCNRIPYSAAIRLFVRVYGRRPEIRSIYLRNGMAEGHWIPNCRYGNRFRPSRQNSYRKPIRTKRGA